MENSKIRPLSDRVVVKPNSAETKTASGIIIPQVAQKRPNKGSVYAVGPGKKDSLMSLKEGQQVIYGKNVGMEIEIDNEIFLIMREDDVIAIL